MKKIAKLLAYALPALVVVACTNVDENVEPNGGSEGNSICLTLNANTKTTLGDDGKTVTWANDDKVGLFADYVVGGEATVLGANAEYAYNNENAFTGELEYGAEVADNYNFYAYYPYAEGEVAHNAVVGTLPAAQTYDAAAESYDLSAADFMWGKAVGVAKSGNIAIEMHHTFALMQFTITNSLAEEVTVNGVTIASVGETLAGAFTANLADGTVTFTTPAEAIEVATDLTIAAGAKGVVKFMMNAVDLSGKDVVVSVAYNGSEEYSETFDGRNVAPAGNYNKNIAIAPSFVEPNPTTDWYVKIDGTGKGASWEYATTLDNALLNAPAGATIHVAAGTYVPTTEAQGAPAGDAYKTFEITKNITLKGGYPADATTGAVAAPATNATVLDGNATSYHVVLVTSPEKAVLEGLTIQNGNCNGSDTFDSSIANVGVADKAGAGIYAVYTTVEVNNCQVINNTGTQGAGVYLVDSDVSINNTTVSGNTCAGNGGGIWQNNGTLTINGSKINANGKLTDAGIARGLYIYAEQDKEATATVTNTEIKGNLSKGNIAGVYVRGDKGTVSATFNGCTISENKGASYAGMSILNATAAFTGCTISQNEGGQGAGFYMSGATVKFDGCTISKNAATGNGAFYITSGSNLTILNSTFSQNTSSGLGMMYIYNNSSKHTYIANTVFEDNSARGRGGAMYLRQNVKATIVNSTFKGNTATSYGSAISLYGTGTTANVISCTFSENSGSNATGGGALSTENNDNVTLNICNSIISGNTNTGGNEIVDIHQVQGTINYKNVVVGDKVHGADGAVVAGKTFNASDFGTYANGVYPISNTSVAWTSGMSAADLYTTGSGINADLFTAAVMQADQKGNARTGNVMGAYVGQ